jgi:putative peptidoglycan lipid II flippase
MGAAVTPVRVASTLTVLPPAIEATAPLAEGVGRRVPPGDSGAAPARSALVMASGTALSRASGFARLLAVAWVLGQGRLADAYNQANTIPNSIYELLLGGVLSATLLPVFMQSLGPNRPYNGGVKKVHLDAGGAEEAIGSVVTFLTVLLVLATVIFWLLAPFIIQLFLLNAHGPQVVGEKFLATTWLRLFTPQLLFLGLITLTTALLNARRRFGAVAFSPVLANVVTIVALVVADSMVHPSSIAGYRSDAAAVAVVGIGTTAGYFVQLLAQLPPLVRAHVPFRLCWLPSHPALCSIRRLSGWTIGAVATNQASYVLVAVLANTRRGNFSAFSYAYTFMLLPYAIIGASIAYAVAPELAERWSSSDKEGFARQVSRSVKMTLLLLVPGGVGYALVARLVAVVTLAHGHLDISSARLTGSLLVVFAAGLPGFSTYLLIMRAFQSKQDTRSLFWLYVVENSVTIGAAAALYPVLGVRGLAAAWVGAYSVTLPLAWYRLQRDAPASVELVWLMRVAAATVVMGAAVGSVVAFVPSTGLAQSVGKLALAVAIGAAVFAGTARALGVEEVAEATGTWRALPARLFGRERAR